MAALACCIVALSRRINLGATMNSATRWATVAFLFSLFALPATLFSKGRAPWIRSPEVLEDKRVIFRIKAPKATEVTITGDWMPPKKSEIPLAKDDDGVWSITLGPLEPGIAIYNFTVDGLAIADPVNPKMKLRSRTSASLLEVPGDGKQLWEAQDVPHGDVEINYIKSKAISDQTREVRVYTPPGYDADPTKKYPVLYLLHGNNDTAAGWTEVGRANYILDNLIAQKKAVPMIVVMPWGHVLPYGQRGANTALFEKYLIDDLIPAIEKSYRVAPGRENRALVGLSMGGGQALNIGPAHLDLFSALGAYSAAVPRDFETYFKEILDDPTNTNAKLKVFYIGCGKLDPGFSRSEKLDALLKAHKINHIFRPSEGYHNYANWRLYLGETVPLLFQWSDSFQDNGPTKAQTL
jgi:enterochelin esterase-like enzyme